MSRLVLLSDTDALAAYAHEYFQRSGSHVELRYLRSAQVYAYYVRGEMVAGFVINSSPPLRYLTMLPPEDDSRHRLLALTAQGGVTEITCIWMDAQRLRHCTRMALYMHCILCARRAKNRWILGGTRKEKVMRIHSIALPIHLFSGYTSYRGVEERFWLYCGQRRFILVTLAMAIVKQTLCIRRRRATPLIEVHCVGAPEGHRS
jgi:hypothetical protein